MKVACPLGTRGFTYKFVPMSLAFGRVITIRVIYIKVAASKGCLQRRVD